MAWAFGVEHITMLVIFGVLSLSLVALYLYYATLPGRPVASGRTTLTLAHNLRHSNLNKIAVTVGIEIGSQAKWPEGLETAGNLEVQPCR